MRYLGIDFGSKRIGLAISDESMSFAMPLKVIENSKNIVKDVLDICQEKKIDVIVVGESLDFSMKENEIMKEVNPFVSELREKSGLPVVLHPEFMTSAEALRTQPRRMPPESRLREREMKNNMLDASAAAIILKAYLDKIKNDGK